MPITPINQNSFTISFAADSTIYENTVRCRVNENDFNYSHNPSLTKAVDSPTISTNSIYEVLYIGIDTFRTIKTTFNLSFPAPYDIIGSYTVEFATTILLFPNTASVEFKIPAGSSTVDNYLYYNEQPYNITGIVTNISNTYIDYYRRSTFVTNGVIKDFATGSEFKPYATTVGLYNDADELLVVGKLSTPYPIPNNTDVNFIIRWDS